MLYPWDGVVCKHVQSHLHKIFLLWEICGALKIAQIWLIVLDKFLRTQHLPRLNHREKQNMNRPLTNKEIESVIKNQIKKEFWKIERGLQT